MLILLLIYVSKKIKKIINVLKKRTVSMIFFKVKLILILVLFTGVEKVENNKNSDTLVFKILNKDSKIGYVKIEKYSQNLFTVYKLKSEVNYRVLIKFKILNEEESVYFRDSLRSSFIYRKVNKKVKLKHSVSLKNGNYLVYSSNKTSKLNYKVIKLNLNKLLFYEPSNINLVYCDKLMSKLPIVKIGKNKYKVSFSKSAYNVYHYSQGRCSLIEAKSTFFNVRLVSGNFKNN